MGLADGIRQVALSATKTFGQSASVRSITPGSYDPDVGQVTGRSVTTTAVKCSVRAFTASELGDTVQLGDLEVEIPAGQVATALSTKDEFVFDGKTYAVVNAERIYVQDTVVVDRLQVRR